MSIWRISLSAVLVLATLAGAKEVSQTSKPSSKPAFKQKSSQPSKSDAKLLYDLGIGMMHYRYSEPGLMHISGPMFSAYGSFGYVNSLFKFQTDLSYSTYVGVNRYDGGIQHEDGSITLSQTKSQDWYAATAAKFGLTLFEQKERFFAYIGLGYRFLANDLQDQGEVKSSYRRYQGYLYLPVGLTGELALTPMFSLIGGLEYRILLFGHNHSMLTDIHYDKNVFFRQHNGYGGRVSAGMRFYMSAKYSLKLLAYWDFWSLDKSSIALATSPAGTRSRFIEPKNHTNEFGATLGFSF